MCNSRFSWISIPEPCCCRRANSSRHSGHVGGSGSGSGSGSNSGSGGGSGSYQLHCSTTLIVPGFGFGGGTVTVLARCGFDGGLSSSRITMFPRGQIVTRDGLGVTLSSSKEMFEPCGTTYFSQELDPDDLRGYWLPILPLACRASWRKTPSTGSRLVDDFFFAGLLMAMSFGVVGCWMGGFPPPYLDANGSGFKVVQLSVSWVHQPPRFSSNSWKPAA